jgi:LEA14-like dessication related protein
MLEQRPSARVVGATLEDVSLRDATLAFDVEVTNPYSLPLPLVDVDYALSGRGKPLVSGKAPLTGTIPAGQKRTFQVPAKVTFSEVLSALRDFRPGQVLPYTAEMGFSLDTPVLGALRLPVRKEGELPVPTAPDVRLQQIRWEKLTLRQAKGVVELALTNRNEFSMDLREMTSQLSLSGVEVGRLDVSKAVSLARSGGKGSLEIPISFSAAKVGLGLFRMLSGSGAQYDLTGSLDVATPYAPMRLPLSAKGTVPFLE